VGALIDTVESLPLNFPQTFLPERRLLAQLLPFAAKNGFGDKVEIGTKTGIPTGESTGKVEPMIRYSEGMGLITASKTSGNWKLGVTPLGRIILNEDPFLSEQQTLWMMHLLLCRRLPFISPARGLCDPWFALFAEGGFRLGNRFSQNDFLNFLIDRHGRKGYLKSLSSVVIRSYLEESCFSPISALQECVVNGDKILLRQSAPANKQFFPVYAAFLYLIWDELFCNESQVALDILSNQSRFFLVLGWDEAMIAGWLDWMSDEGIIQIDRHTGSPILLRLKKTEQIIGNIYGELL
jgi:hypothetical protein